MTTFRLVRAAFGTTLPHPALLVTRLGGQRALTGLDCAFACYCVRDLTARPHNSFFGEARRLGPLALSRALRCTVLALLEQNGALSALPACCLLEYVASEVRLDARATARARVLRVRCLAKAGLVAHAASQLASLLRGARLPAAAGAYAGRTPTSPTKGPICDSLRWVCFEDWFDDSCSGLEGVRWSVLWKKPQFTRESFWILLFQSPNLGYT